MYRHGTRVADIVIDSIKTSLVQSVNMQIVLPAPIRDTKLLMLVTLKLQWCLQIMVLFNV